MKKLHFNKPYPKQRLFFQSRTRYTAYGGSRGGGKSEAARNKAILLCLRYAGIQVLFMRRTYPEIKENHLLPAMKTLAGVARFNGTDKAFSFPNGARLKFGYCKTDSDLLQYQGQAYDVIFLEECTQFAENVFLTMTESNRSSGLMTERFSPRMYFTCNPGGVGHAWFKRLFVDRAYKGTEKAEDYVFIQASVYDNPVLMRGSPDYVRALENLPTDRKRAMLYGDWDVFEGQYFPEFQREVHTCLPFPIPAHWRRYRVFDYGFDMFACYFVAMDEHGRAYFYKEICEGRDNKDAYGNEGTPLIVSEAAKRMLQATAADERIDATYAPPDMWNKKQDTGASPADIFAEYEIYLTRAQNSRVKGWLETKEWLRVREDGTARILIFSNCVNLIRCLPLLLHDERDPNDVSLKPHEITHAPDALRYFCASRALPTEVPREYDEPDYEDEVAGLFHYDG